jgi:hypothetical protein
MSNAAIGHEHSISIEQTRTLHNLLHAVPQKGDQTILKCTAVMLMYMLIIRTTLRCSIGF